MNELSALGMQIAFVLPTSMLLLFPVTRYSVYLFYPAMMILLGAHYIPFVFLYGMRIYAGLAALLAGGGVFVALTCGSQFSIGAWYTAAVLFLFSLLAKAIVAKERKCGVPNKTADSMTSSGTSAAEQPRVPPSATSHL